jgi:hypothetical protein
MDGLKLTHRKLAKIALCACQRSRQFASGWRAIHVRVAPCLVHQTQRIGFNLFSIGIKGGENRDGENNP